MEIGKKKINRIWGSQFEHHKTHPAKSKYFKNSWKLTKEFYKNSIYRKFRASFKIWEF